MTEQEKAGRFDRAAALLPLSWQRFWSRLDSEQKAAAEEIRLRCGRPVTVLAAGEELRLWEETCVTQEDLEQICDRVTGYARYLAAETLRQGYLTAEGGFRIGVCGTAVMEQGAVKDLRSISSLAIRISRPALALAEPLLPRLYPEGRLKSTLILSPPGLGKTTLLRDLIRALSDGCGAMPPLRVAVADERGELAVMYNGLPQMDVGRSTDVLDGCPKALAIPMLLRSADPQVIAVDEITQRQDVAAMADAAHCGVTLLATVHAGSAEELQKKPLFRQLLQLGVFETSVTITAEQGRRLYRVEPL